METKNRTIGISQPVYLPWLGYFEQMAYVDQFVFMDDVQYTRHDWRNRNRIKTASGSIWLTVPVHSHPRSAAISEILIDYSQNWLRKHLRAIEVNYCKCPYYQPLSEDLAKVLSSKPKKLVDLTVALIRTLCLYVDIEADLAFSSAVPRQPTAKKDGEESREAEKLERRNSRIIDICHHFGASRLYDGKSATQFVDVGRFRREGIEVVFQEYHHPVYPQAFGDFMSHQSIIDLVMNTGPDAPSILRSSPPPSFWRQTEAAHHFVAIQDRS
jgi:hypothetical protein